MQMKFSQYENVRKALSRSGIKNQGAIATILLQTFVERNGKMKAEDVYAKKLCAPGKFKEWRKTLINKDWIIFELEDQKFSRYRPGRKLIPYLNREKLENQEIATKDDINRVADTTDKIEHRLSALEKVVAGMMAKYDPPVTKDKLDDSIAEYKALGDEALKKLSFDTKTKNKIPF